MSDDFLQGVVKFKKKPAKSGPEYAFFIPRTFVKNGLIDVSKTYEIYLKVVEDDEESHGDSN